MSGRLPAAWARPQASSLLDGPLAHGRCMQSAARLPLGCSSRASASARLGGGAAPAKQAESSAITGSMAPGAMPGVAGLL